MRSKVTSLYIFIIIMFVVVLVACQPGVISNEKYSFIFKGTLEVNEITYNTTLVGNEENENTFELIIGSFDPIEGNFIFVEGKGYVFYFGDYIETVKKTTWDPQTKEFILNYTVDLGSARGKGVTIMKYKNENFVETEDNEWPFIPFSFYGEANVMGIADVTTTVTLFEDGTLNVSGTTTAGVYSGRNGIWSYDNDTNTYTFVMDPLDSMFGPVPTEYVSLYNSETGEYYFTLDVVIVMSAQIVVSYIAE